MISVTIKYRPFKWFRYTRYLERSFPQTWGEISHAQLIVIACLINQSISDVSFLAKMTLLPVRIIKKLDDYQRFQLIELFDSFHSDKPFYEFIIPKLNCNHTDLFHPKPQLSGTTFGQFIFMDTYFGNYQEFSKTDDLNKFIASAYLPYNQKFEEKLVDENHLWVANLDLVTREAIVINYHLIRLWLSKTYPLVFIAPPLKNDPNQPKKKRDPAAWIKVFDGLVGDDIVNENNYANLPFHTVMRFLTNNIKKRK